MGRPPSNGGPAFRFMTNEVTEMESILQEHNNAMPIRDVLVALADKFTESTERKGKTIVQMKQVWNWFQNRRYAIRAKSSKTPVKLNVSPMPREESTPMRTVPQLVAAPMNAPVPTTMAIPSVPNVARAATENSYMEFEAKSSRDGAWYDVGTFLSHRHLDTGDPEALVRFAGFGPDEDEWINIRKHVRQRSLPCEASECVAVLPGDLILCFQEGKDQALYYDAHVLDAQRRRHDVRGCRCRFLVRYDHDQSEEIVPLRKVCRRPETDYRLHQLQSANDLANTDQKKATTDPTKASIQRISVSSAETVHKQPDLRLGALALSRANISVPAKIPMPVPKEAETSSTVNVGNPSIQSSSTVNVGNPSIQASSTVNVGNPSIQASSTVNVGNPNIQAAHPSIQSSSTVNVGNPSIQASSTINIGNPSNHTSSTVNVGNPSNHPSSTINVGNPSNDTSSTVNVGNPPSNHASSAVNVGNHSTHGSSTMTIEPSIAAPNSAPGPGGSVENVQGGN